MIEPIGACFESMDGSATMVFHNWVMCRGSSSVGSAGCSFSSSFHQAAVSCMSVNWLFSFGSDLVSSFESEKLHQADNLGEHCSRTMSDPVFPTISKLGYLKLERSI